MCFFSSLAASLTSVLYLIEVLSGFEKEVGSCVRLWIFAGELE